MLQMGQITEILKDEPKILVRVPIFENTSDQNKVIIPCRVIYQPGSIGGYNVGDIVLVDCVNEDWDAPLLVGKLYNGNEDSPKTALHVQSLKVDGKTILSADTKIGDITYQQLTRLIEKVDILQETSDTSLRAAELNLNAISTTTPSGFGISNEKYVSDKYNINQMIEKNKNELSDQLKTAQNTIESLETELNTTKEKLRLLTIQLESILYIYPVYMLDTDVSNARLAINTHVENSMSNFNYGVNLNYINKNTKDMFASYQIYIAKHKLLYNPLIYRLFKVTANHSNEEISAVIDRAIKQNIDDIYKNGYVQLRAENWKFNKNSKNNLEMDVGVSGSHLIKSDATTINGKELQKEYYGNTCQFVSDSNNEWYNTYTSGWKLLPDGIGILARFLNNKSESALGTEEDLYIPILDYDSNCLVKNNEQGKVLVESSKYPLDTVGQCKFRPEVRLEINSLQVMQEFIPDSSQDFIESSEQVITGTYHKLIRFNINNIPTDAENKVICFFRFDIETNTDASEPRSTQIYWNKFYSASPGQSTLSATIDLYEEIVKSAAAGEPLRKILEYEGIEADKLTSNIIYSDVYCRIRDITIESFLCDETNKLIQLSPSTLTFNKYQYMFNEVINHSYFKPKLVELPADTIIDDNGNLGFKEKPVGNIRILYPESPETDKYLLPAVDDIYNLFAPQVDKDTVYIEEKVDPTTKDVIQRYLYFSIGNPNIIYYKEPSNETNGETEQGNSEFLHSSLFKFLIDNIRLEGNVSIFDSNDNPLYMFNNLTSNTWKVNLSTDTQAEEIIGAKTASELEMLNSIGIRYSESKQIVGPADDDGASYFRRYPEKPLYNPINICVYLPNKGSSLSGSNSKENYKIRATKELKIRIEKFKYRSAGAHINNIDYWYESNDLPEIVIDCSSVRIVQSDYIANKTE